MTNKELLKTAIAKRNLLLSIICEKVGDYEIAKDLYQDLLLKICLLKIDEAKTINDGFIIIVARNMTVDYLRKKKLKAVEYDEKQDSNIEEDKNDDLYTTEYLKEVADCIDNLPYRFREVVVLRVYYKKSFEQISSLTGEKLSTVLGKFRYAKNTILKRLT